MTDDFWHFSLAFYGVPGVREALLGLQDDQNADVNMVLFALWCASGRRLLSGRHVQDLESACKPWRDRVIHPLRGARLWLRNVDHNLAPDPVRFRDSLKALELEAERAQQQHMVSISTDWNFERASDEPEAATRNLDSYLQSLPVCSLARGSLPYRQRVLESAFTARLSP